MSNSIVSLNKLAFHYANSSPYSVLTNTSLSIEGGQYRDSTNTVDLLLPSTTTLDTSGIGLNGIDTGVLALDSWYYVYVIGDSTKRKPVGTIISLSVIAPQLPFGYDSFAFIGPVGTNVGSSIFQQFHVTGNASCRTFWWDTSVNVLTSGTSATYAHVVMTQGVAPVSSYIEVLCNTSFIPNAANDIFSIRTRASNATSVLTLNGNVAGKVTKSQISVLSHIAVADPEIDYLVTASGSLSIDVLGFKYYI